MDATYLMGLMAYDFGNLDLAIRHVRRACQSPRAPAVYFSDFAEMCRQAGLLAEGEKAARRAVALQPNLASAWNNLGIILQEATEARGEPALSRTRVGAGAGRRADDQQSRQHLQAAGAGARGREAMARGARTRSPTTPRSTATSPISIMDQGEFDRAERMALRAIELKSAARRRLYQSRGRCRPRGIATPTRLRVLDALLAFAPTYARALAAKALALKDLDRLDEAMDWARARRGRRSGHAGVAQCARPGFSGDGRVRAGAGGL